MNQAANTSGDPGRKPGFRRRLRGGLGGRSGRAVGVSSVLVPLMSYVVYDLQKPDSTVKKLASAMANKFVTWREQRQQLTDISDKAEVISREEDI
jgi:hypothetical protein